MNKEEYRTLQQEMLKETVRNLQVYCRDADLSAESLSFLHSGQLLREPDYSEASTHGGGLNGSCRYRILSNHFVGIDSEEKEKEAGLAVGGKNSRYLVLDMTSEQGKTQICLLHLPDDAGWRFFADAVIPEKEQMIQEARAAFQQAIREEPDACLSRPDWKQRWQRPLGLDEQGRPYEPESPIAEELQNFHDAGFRQLDHHMLYLHSPELVRRQYPRDCRPEDTGLIAYGYLDEQSGLSFQTAALAAMQDTRLRLHKPTVQKERLVMRAAALQEIQFVGLQMLDYDYLVQYRSFAEKIATAYDTRNKDKRTLRALAALDASRHPYFPDDYAVLLYAEGKKMEQVWVRGEKLGQKVIYGTLLNEPQGDFGVHAGQQIAFAPVRQQDGSIVCLAVLKQVS